MTLHARSFAVVVVLALASLALVATASERGGDAHDAYAAQQQWAKDHAYEHHDEPAHESSASSPSAAMAAAAREAHEDVGNDDDDTAVISHVRPLHDSKHARAHGAHDAGAPPVPTTATTAATTTTTATASTTSTASSTTTTTAAPASTRRPDASNDADAHDDADAHWFAHAHSHEHSHDGGPPAHGADHARHVFRTLADVRVGKHHEEAGLFAPFHVELAPRVQDPEEQDEHVEGTHNDATSTRDEHDEVDYHLGNEHPEQLVKVFNLKLPEPTEPVRIVTRQAPAAKRNADGHDAILAVIETAFARVPMRLNGTPLPLDTVGTDGHLDFATLPSDVVADARRMQPAQLNARCDEQCVSQMCASIHNAGHSVCTHVCRNKCEQLVHHVFPNWVNDADQKSSDVYFY